VKDLSKLTIIERLNWTDDNSRDDLLELDL